MTAKQVRFLECALPIIVGIVFVVLILLCGCALFTEYKTSPFVQDYVQATVVNAQKGITAATLEDKDKCFAEQEKAGEAVSDAIGTTGKMITPENVSRRLGEITEKAKTYQPPGTTNFWSLVLQIVVSLITGGVGFKVGQSTGIFPKLFSLLSGEISELQVKKPGSQNDLLTEVKDKSLALGLYTPLEKALERRKVRTSRSAEGETVD